MKICSYCGRDNATTDTHCRECGTSLPTDESSVPVEKMKASVVCPACGTGDDYKTALNLRGPRNSFIFHFGGFFAQSFHNAAREQRVQCNACGEFFNIHTPAAKVSLLVSWILIAPVIGLLLYALYGWLFSRQ